MKIRKELEKYDWSKLSNIIAVPYNIGYDATLFKTQSHPSRFFLLADYPSPMAIL